MAPGTAFVNADLIAAGLSPLAPEQQQFNASRLFRQQIDHHVAEGRDFAFETTPSGRSYLRLVRRPVGGLAGGIALSGPPQRRVGRLT